VIVDPDVTKYACIEKRMFSIYKEVDGEHLYINNSLASKILGVRKVILKMTFKKLLTLTMCYILLTLG
jgi:hypothetical protein